MNKCLNKKGTNRLETFRYDNEYDGDDGMKMK